MKFIYKDISNVLEWTENQLPILQIENQSFFNQVIIDIYEQVHFGYEESFSLIDDKDRTIHSNSRLILEPISLTTNNKDVQKYLGNLLINEMKETYIDLDEKLKPIYNFYEKSFLELPIDIEIDRNFNQRTLSKLFPFTIHDDSETVIEKVYNYLNVMTELNLVDFYIFVNLKQYLVQYEYDNFINFIFNKKIKVLLVENSSDLSHADECCLIVDEDLCEIS